MAVLKGDCVVLRLIDWSETSQIAWLLSREHGRLAATAKGSKRSTPSVQAKFSGGLELATRGEAVVHTKAGRDLGNLTEWRLSDGYWQLRRDLRAFELAMYAVDVAAHLLGDHDPHPRSFDALVHLLEAIGGGEIPSRRTARGVLPTSLLWFQWVLIEDAGYRPVLDRDARTGAALSAGGGAMRFSPRAGGLVDEATPDAWRVRRKTVQLLRRIAAGEATDDADAASVNRANRLLCAYCRAILDKQLPTMRAVMGR